MKKNISIISLLALFTITTFSCTSEEPIVELPNTIKVIGREVFSNSLKLKSIRIPSSVHSIDFGAFRECSNLTEVIMNNNIETIGEYAFHKCYNIKEIKFPKSLKKIEAFALSGNFSEITLPSTIECIKEYNFGIEGLMKIHCKSVTPPIYREEERYSIHDRATVFVPKGSKVRYREADGWKLFSKIEEE